MSTIADILTTWRAPRRGVRQQLAKARDEIHAIALVMVGCALIFVSQWPVHARAAFLDPEIPLGARLTGAAVALLMLAPVLLYGLSALLHLVLKLIGGRGSFFAARIAVFWALLASTPLWLLWGLTEGMVDPGPAQVVTGSLAVLSFAIFLIAGLREAEFPQKGAQDV